MPRINTCSVALLLLKAVHFNSVFYVHLSNYTQNKSRLSLLQPKNQPSSELTIQVSTRKCGRRPGPGCETLINDADLLRCDYLGCYLAVSQFNLNLIYGIIFLFRRRGGGYEVPLDK